MRIETKFAAWMVAYYQGFVFQLKILISVLKLEKTFLQCCCLLCGILLAINVSIK